MSFLLSDPNSRRVRGAISAAVRGGHAELEAELRRELDIDNIERALVRGVGDRPLSTSEFRRLRTVLEELGPKRKPAAVTTPAPDEHVA
jgi:hypothetical protein